MVLKPACSNAEVEYTMYVATVPTVYGIETGRGEDVIAEIFLVATAPTVYGMRRRV